MGKLQNIGGALLLLGLYHVFMQQYVFTSSATSGVGRGRRGTEATLAQPPCKTSSAVAAEVSADVGDSKEWSPPTGSNLRANEAAALLLATAEPRKTTVHFTFGSFSMMDFLHNWRHFILEAGLAPAVVGAADSQMFRACSR